MHNTTVEEWSRGSSPVHRRAAAAKLVPLAVFLVVVATAHRRLLLLAAGLCAILIAGILAARLPLGGSLWRAAAVLPFSGLFALVSWFAGDPARSVEMIVKSYVSALSVLLLASTTPLPELVRCLEIIKVPHFLLTVVQFLSRYLTVVVDEASCMRAAAAARGGMTFRAAAGALAVLFARSYARAEGIHYAMTARGFTGRFPVLAVRRLSARDAQFAAVAVAVPVLMRVAVEVVR